jgi:hypothetical protein
VELVPVDVQDAGVKRRFVGGLLLRGQSKRREHGVLWDLTTLHTTH